LEKNRRVKEDKSVQCVFNSGDYLRELEKKLSDSKKFYLSEVKAFKKRINNLENEKNVMLDEEKKFTYTIKVKLNFMFNYSETNGEA
jgi:hypothetical protein